jgi:eukaryotic-like serine/threonine-protein kinase
MASLLRQSSPNIYYESGNSSVPRSLASQIDSKVPATKVGFCLEQQRFLTSNGSESNGQISPDGKWVAYASDESCAWEIYVSSFPAAMGKWQVSRGGGTEPRWRADGKEIFYISPSGMLMAVPVNGEATIATGRPAPLFQIHGRASISSTDTFTYDVAKDGKRFLVNRYVKPDHVPPLTILLHAAGNPQ